MLSSSCLIGVVPHKELRRWPSQGGCALDERVGRAHHLIEHLEPHEPLEHVVEDAHRPCRHRGALGQLPGNVHDLPALPHVVLEVARCALFVDNAEGGVIGDGGEEC